MKALREFICQKHRHTRKAPGLQADTRMPGNPHQVGLTPSSVESGGSRRPGYDRAAAGELPVTVLSKEVAVTLRDTLGTQGASAQMVAESKNIVPGLGADYHPPSSTMCLVSWIMGFKD